MASNWLLLRVRGVRTVIVTHLLACLVFLKRGGADRRWVILHSCVVNRLLALHAEVFWGRLTSLLFSRDHALLHVVEDWVDGSVRVVSAAALAVDIWH